MVIHRLSAKRQHFDWVTCWWTCMAIDACTVQLFNEPSREDQVVVAVANILHRHPINFKSPPLLFPRRNTQYKTGSKLFKTNLP